MQGLRGRQNERILIILYEAAGYIKEEKMINGELIVDNFAGGGGASTGIETATGYSVDIAVNHDPETVRMHKANHPGTRHYCESVWAVNPVEACAGRPVALAWFSPDCKHFSKAKGGKPKDRNIRGLAWVALRWAGLVRPRVLILENVEEFKDWGPLNRRHRPVKKKKGETFRRFVGQLQALGYEVQSRELTAADYGAPTMRKRLFLIARSDGKPIVWPAPEYAPRDSEAVKSGLLKPYKGAYTQIDFSRPCPSIFDTKQEIWEKYGIRAQRPLAEKTMRRIARGLQKFVLENPEPFLIQINHGRAVRDDLPVITTGNRNFLIAPALIQYHSETTDNGVRGQQAADPIMTVDASNRYALVSAFIQKYFDGGYKGAGADIKNPLPTVTARDHNSMCAVHLIQMNNHCDGRNITEPIPTITAGDGHFGEVRAFLMKYYGQGIGQNIKGPLGTVTANDRFGLVTVKGMDYAIVDIGLRMLEPRELYGCQGFPEDYIIDRDDTGKSYSRAEQVKRCGNAVCPPVAAALVRANLPELCVAERMPNMRIDASREQLSFVI